MLSFSSHQKYFIYSIAADMRKGYNGLSGIVRHKMQSDPTNGDVYVFFNKSRHLMKMLVWDNDGFVIYSKRLEKGVFEKIREDSGTLKYAIQYNHLVMLISGVSLIGIKQRPRYKMLQTG